MSRPKVVVTHWIHPEVLDELARECDVVANRTLDSYPDGELRERVRDARGILAFMPDRIDAAFLDQCPRLEIIGGAFKGFDNIDVDACTARGVWVTVVPDLLTEPTAELGVALLLSLSRRLIEGDRMVRAGGFRGWRPVMYGIGLSGRTVGIVGMGAVGQALAARLSGFSCRLLYHDSRSLSQERERELRLGRASLSDLLGASDHVVLAVPLTPDTRRLLNAQTLAGMRRGATLVNLGRGSVVDEQAAAAALRSGHLGGYAADVFACEDLSVPERPSGIPCELLSADLQTVFTPHLGSAVHDARLAIARAAACSILDHFRGIDPACAVNRPAAAAKR